MARECKRHPGHFVQAARAARGNLTGCAVCDKDTRVKGQLIRAKKYDDGFIACINHLDRLASRSLWIHNSHRLCSSCRNHKQDGSRRPAYQRDKNTRAFNLMMGNRGFGGRASGIQIFERLTGMSCLMRRV